MSMEPHYRRKALKAAFPHTLPIMAGFLFLGTSYGIYMSVSGFSFVYPMVMAFVIFGGSLEFVAVTMLLAPFAPLATALMALMIQARHLFYGLSMLDKFKGTGWKKPYLIFGMCDESFSINYSTPVPQGIDRGWFMFWVTLLNQIYWVVGATFGGLMGGLMTINIKGLDFVMTAMFVVIFLNQWFQEKQHFGSIIGLVATVVCRLGFGADNFMIPTMIVIVIVLFVFRKPIERKEDAA